MEIRDKYQTDGYVPARSTGKNPEDFEFIRHCTDAINHGNTLNNHVITIDLFSEKIINTIVCPAIINDAFEILGTDCPIALWSGVIWVKKAKTSSGSLCWHQDTMYWRHDFENKKAPFITPDNMETVTAWIAIDNVSKENGAIEILPSSHGKPYHLSEMYSQDAKIKSGRHGFYVPEMKPGEYILFHHDAFHCSPENKSDKRRAVAILRFCKLPIIDPAFDKSKLISIFTHNG